ncbi:hypothetical protein [Roseisalinus antarcticus]|uniref:Uncharacterized protein n=1 Tax=Roseisalinus antarcticus TaxID=254357 RepID=A0A1Y5SH02_9RHOB|nr:hypothetical protein [Roseisalinus antarcticus]SLN40632.1 hypothetical protein ROA7023_01596 [Roseisalinus antarcticus]
MIRAALAVLCLATPAAAAFDVTTKHGDWQGAGQMLRGGTTGAIRCRISLEPQGAATFVTGRCAIPEGGIEIGLLLTPQPDGSVIARGQGVEPNTTTRIEELTGTPDDNALTLRGTADGETAAVQFVPLDGDGLRIATTRQTRAGTEETSVVDLTRR